MPGVVMMTGGSPSLRTADGDGGSVSASSPRWLRLVRYGDTITGYDSADGTRWTAVGTATLRGLISAVQAGLSWPATGWTGTDVGYNPGSVQLPGSFRQSSGVCTVTSSGDIAPRTGLRRLWDIFRYRETSAAAPVAPRRTSAPP
jgi:hypothetical protein